MKNNILLLIALFYWTTGFGQYTLKHTGGYIQVKDSTNLVLQNTSFINNSDFEAGTGTLTMMGDASSSESIIKGTVRPVFYNLNINKTANEVQLLAPITVENELQMVLGNIDLKGSNIILDGTASIINENDNSYIYSTTSGQVIKSASLNAPNQVNPGNIGITFTSNADLGALSLLRYHSSEIVNGEAGINRHYAIYGANTENLDATLRLHYMDVDLNGIEESKLEVFRRPNNNVWQYYETIAADQSSNYVETSGVNSLETILTLAEGDIKLEPVVLFESNYQGNGLMNDDLRVQGIIPTAEPFTALGFTHIGGGREKIESSIFDVTGDNAIVDWVLLQLRDKNDHTIVLNTRSALIQKDGDIVDLNGVAPISFPGMAPDNYFFSVIHRNHLGVLSSVSTTLALTAGGYDFTLDPIDTEGGLLGVSDLGDGFYGLISGDFDHNGQVQNTDAQDQTNTIGLAGYLQGDLDLNGQVQNSELQLRLIPNIGKGAQFNY